MSRSEPPDWTLPAWDALGGGESPAGRRSSTPAGTLGLRILSVSEVTGAVRDALRADERLRDVWVEGEVGRVTISSAGHAYFTLKDERSQLSCVWFRDERLMSPFEPAAGLRVVAHGRVDVFDAQGVYQLYVSAVQPAGFGDLALRFEALKARLAAEGLFDAGRKRPLPLRPATIGVATSASGAVWHDIRTVLSRRWPLAQVVISPCLVQGDGAPASIVVALRRLAWYTEERRAAGRPEDAPAITILARGGGSLEDMWPFNDERVVRAVVGHPMPVVCGVGHETDVTLADFAADVRAPTPSAAAEMVVPDRADVRAAIGAESRRLTALVERGLAARAAELREEGRALARLGPTTGLVSARERAGYLLDRATAAVSARLAGVRHAEERARARLAHLVAGRLERSRAALETRATALATLGPQATLDRGYAIVRRAADGTVVRAPADAPPGTRLALRVARGELPATADERRAT